MPVTSMQMFKRSACGNVFTSVMELEFPPYVTDVRMSTFEITIQMIIHKSGIECLL